MYIFFFATLRVCLFFSHDHVQLQCCLAWFGVPLGSSSYLRDLWSCGYCTQQNAHMWTRPEGSWECWSSWADPRFGQVAGQVNYQTFSFTGPSFRLNNRVVLTIIYESFADGAAFGQHICCSDFIGTIVFLFLPHPIVLAMDTSKTLTKAICLKGIRGMLGKWTVKVYQSELCNSSHIFCNFPATTNTFDWTKIKLASSVVYWPV